MSAPNKCQQSELAGVHVMASLCTVLISALLSTSFITTANAEALDADVATDAFLQSLVTRLDAHDIDVTTNLNDRDFARRISNARLGRFPDLPVGRYPGSASLTAWEQAFGAGELGGLALLPARLAPENAAAEPATTVFLQRWLNAAVRDTLMISFAVADAATLASIGEELQDLGFYSLLLDANTDPAVAGELYATAAQRLALDSSQARRIDSEVPEIAFLGERVRRGTNSLFRDDGNRGNRSLARNEPAVFLKETLGDEFSESTIREIIVPGGVALGETAYVSEEISSARFEVGELILHGQAGQHWQLPAVDAAALKALFDFTRRSLDTQSDAIVDIDADGRVSISAALRDTDVGFAIMHADTLPFQTIDYLRVTKSVMIDTGVDWFVDPAHDDTLMFASSFEVRFLSADNMRIAQTRVALEYEYESTDANVSYIDNWGEEGGRLRENTDFDGLGNSVGKVAEYAGWIALFRYLLEQEVPFRHGRYAFMKLDKAGQETPYRY